jgi:hypothetical protein
VTEAPKGGDLFIVDNSVSGRTGLARAEIAMISCQNERRLGVAVSQRQVATSVREE